MNSLLKAGFKVCAISRTMNKHQFLWIKKQWNRLPLALRLIFVTGLVAGICAGCSQSSKISRHLSRADKYYQAEQYTKAQIEYLNALRLDPTNAVAIRQLGFLFYQMGEIPQAYTFLKTAADMDTNNMDVRLKLGMTFLTVRKLKEARAESIVILSRQPTNDEAMMMLADAVGNTNDIVDVRKRLEGLGAPASSRPGYHLALATLQFRQRDVKGYEMLVKKALEANPNFSPALSAMGNLCVLSNDIKQAETYYQKAAELSPSRSGRWLKYAEFKVQTGDLEAGKKILNDVYKKAPDYLPVALRLADIALSERDLEKSSSFVKKVLAQDPVNYEGAILSARLKVGQNQPAKALAELERLTQLYPSNAPGLYHLAQVQLINTNLNKAVDTLNQAVSYDTNYSDAIVLLAELNARSGKASLAINSLTDLLRRQPQLVRAHMALANIYRSQNDMDNELAVYRRVATLVPKNPQPHYLMGLILQAQNKTAEARKAYETTLQLAPDDFLTIMQLVGINLKEKNYTAAMQLVQKPLEKYPKATEPKMLLASVQLAQGDTNAAIATLKSTIEADPNAQNVYMMLASVYISSGLQKQALGELQTVVSKNPSNTPALMIIATLHDQAKNYQAARDAYEKILAVNPMSYQVLNNLAYLYCERLSELDKAYDYAMKARKILPQDPYAADTLGWILFKRGDYPRALPLIQESATKLEASTVPLPGLPEVQYHLGIANYMMGNEDSARNAFVKALSSTNQYTGKTEAAERLAFLNTNMKTGGQQLVAGLEKRLTQEPNDTIALIRLANIRESEGKADQAVKIYEKALQSNPNAVPILVSLAQLYAGNMKQTAKALELARNARNLAPEDGHVSHVLGKLAMQTGDHKWALALLQESALKLPDQPEVHFDLALAQYSNGRVMESVENMKKAMQTGKTWANAESARRFIAISTLYLDPAKAKQSMNQIQAALKDEPDYLPALMATGIVSEKAGNLAAARQVYEKILTIYPAFTPVIRQFALLYASDSKDENKAFDLATKAREAFPQDAELAKTLGLLNYRRAEYSRSTQLLMESSRTLSTDAEVFFYLGMAQNQLKAKKESAEALRQALALNLKVPLADEAKKVLANIR